MEEDEPVKTDLKYWAIHALHWHALLLAIVAFLAVGYSMHGYPQ